ncbi:MAG: hypothetical protein EBR79_04560 [Proteobacteria bacterium]|nr:hypothetical protein [Pseudomonadota bacterium]
MAFTVQHPQTPFTFIQLHPQSPYTPNAFAKRNVELAALTSPTFPAPVVAVGDLNTTPWDNALHPLRQNLTFRGPWLPTFPSFMPLAPIDLVLSSPHWPTQNIQRVHVPGTDHLAIVANFPTPPKQP